VAQATKAMNDKLCDYSLGFCRTGQGVNILANHVPNVRAALVFDEYTAEHAIRHNCANFFAFPDRLYESSEKVGEVLEILMTNTFDGGRHQARIQDLEI
jgi:ribose 5-phosphate isomerase B